MSKFTDRQYRDAAEGLRRFGTDDVEVDVDAEVSTGEDDGAWVQAWVWVHNSEVQA